MEIAVIGCRAHMLCKACGLVASTFSSCAAAAQRRWDLLALLPDAQLPLPEKLHAGTLILPGSSNVTLLHNTQASQIVGYGFSPRDTLTLSSLTGHEHLICLQRSILTLTGRLIEPQELPLPLPLSFLSADDALPLAGVWLLADL